MPVAENLNKTPVRDATELPAPKKGFADCLKRGNIPPDRILLKDAGFEDEDPNSNDLDVEPKVIDEFDTSIAHYLVGKVSGRFPGQKAIMKCVSSWNCTLNFHPTGWTVLKFNSTEDKDWVMENGPYYIFGRPFFVRIMPHLFDFNNEEILRTSLWVRFPSLPLQLWNAEALSLIASKFGRPLCSDRKTRTKERISFARVLIEMDVAKGKISQIRLNLPNGNSILQEAIYEYWPRICLSYNAIGHLVDTCQFHVAKSNQPTKSSAKAPSGVNTAGKDKAVFMTKNQQGVTETNDKASKNQLDATESRSKGLKLLKPIYPQSNNATSNAVKILNRADTEPVQEDDAVTNSVPKGKEKMSSEPEQPAANHAAVKTDSVPISKGKEKASDSDQPKNRKKVHWQEAGDIHLLDPIPENEDTMDATPFEKPKRKNKDKGKATAEYESGNSDLVNAIVLGNDTPSKGAVSVSKKKPGKGKAPSTHDDNC